MMEGVYLWERWRIEKGLQKSLSMTYNVQLPRRCWAAQDEFGTPVEYYSEDDEAA